MGQHNATFGHHLDQITAAELAPEIPPHAQHDDLVIEVPSLEAILCRGRFDHAGRYRAQPSFSSLHQIPYERGAVVRSATFTIGFLRAKPASPSKPSKPTHP